MPSVWIKSYKRVLLLIAIVIGTCTLSVSQGLYVSNFSDLPAWVATLIGCTIGLLAVGTIIQLEKRFIRQMVREQMAEYNSHLDEEDRNAFYET